MFARVITARTDDGFDGVIALANQQLPDARQRPGFAGYYLLTDDTTGNVVIVSLWQTRADMDAVSQGTTDGVHGGGVAAAGLLDLRLDTYEVPAHS